MCLLLYSCYSLRKDDFILYLESVKISLPFTFLCVTSVHYIVWLKMVLNLEVETDVVYIDLAYDLSEPGFLFLFCHFLFSVLSVFSSSPVYTIIVSNK